MADKIYFPIQFTADENNTKHAVWNQNFLFEMDGVSYSCEIRFNYFGKFWVLAVGDCRTKIVSGWRDLFRRFHHKNIPPGVINVTKGISTPGLYDLGIKSKLYYEPV